MTDPAPTELQRVVLCVNSKASGYADYGPGIRAELGRTCAVEVVDSASEDLGEALRTRAAEFDAVFVAGGDGTINFLLGTLIDVGLPVGVIPIGTANDLARTLGLDPDPILAIRQLVDGQCHRVDVGEVNGHYFINVASIGLGARVVRQMDKSEKSRLGVLSYPLALFRAYRLSYPQRVELTVDDETFRLRIVQLGVGNGHYHGGGVAVSETVNIADGKLDVYAVRPTPIWRLPWVMARLLFRAHSFEKAIETYVGRKIEVRTRRPVDVNIDGELLTKTPARFRTHHNALRVLAPRGWTSESGLIDAMSR